MKTQNKTLTQAHTHTHISTHLHQSIAAYVNMTAAQFIQVLINVEQSEEFMYYVFLGGKK